MSRHWPTDQIRKPSSRFHVLQLQMTVQPESQLAEICVPKLRSTGSWGLKLAQERDDGLGMKARDGSPADWWTLFATLFRS